MININKDASGRLEMLFEGDILSVPDFDLKKIRASDKWEKADDTLLPTPAEKLWNDNSYWYGTDYPGFRKLGRDNRTFSEIATDKTGLYRIIEMDSYDKMMNRDELVEVIDKRSLYCWVRFYGRIEIHGLIYGGTRTRVTITHIQKLYYQMIV